MSDPHGRIPGSDPGDYADEMERNPHVTPQEAGELMAGRIPSGRNDLSELDGFLRAARDLAHEGPDPLTEQRHLAAMAEATHLEPEGELFAPRSRRDMMVQTILRSKWFKATAAAIAAVLATGGLAAAQALPAPAQDAVAGVAQSVGIGIPDSDGNTKRGMDHDGDGVADDNGKHTGQTKVKDGADHDGDGVADDNGNHGQTGDDPASDDPTVKDGADHDGDGVADDNGNHTGQTKVKDGKDHDGDGVADDNGKHLGDSKAGSDQGQQGDDEPGEAEDHNQDKGQDNNDNGHNGNGQSHAGSHGEDSNNDG